MFSEHEIYDKLQKKKDNGEAMSGHERMQLDYVTQIIVLKTKLKMCVDFIETVSDKRNWSEAYYGEEYPTEFDYDDATILLKKLQEIL
jgi:hypothetical protein